MIVRDSAAKHDGLQIEFLTQFLAVLVHTASQAQATIVWMNEHLDAIEDVAMRVMGVEGLVARDLGVGVVAFHHVIVDDDGEGAAHDLVIHDDDHLTFREDSNEFLDLCTSPEDIGVGIDTLE